MSPDPLLYLSRISVVFYDINRERVSRDWPECGAGEGKCLDTTYVTISNWLPTDCRPLYNKDKDKYIVASNTQYKPNIGEWGRAIVFNDKNNIHILSITDTSLLIVIITNTIYDIILYTITRIRAYNSLILQLFFL